LLAFKLKSTHRETEGSGEAGRYEYLRGGAANAPGYRQVRRDLLAQVRLTARIWIRHRRGRRLARRATEHGRPQFDWERVLGGHPI